MGGGGGPRARVGEAAALEAAGGAHALEFTLDGFVPNPARAGFRVAFTLPDASPARLELFDLAGRLVTSRSFDAPEPGRHTIGFDRSLNLRPGVYVLRLTQGRRTLSARRGGAVMITIR